MQPRNLKVASEIDLKADFFQHRSSETWNHPAEASPLPVPARVAHSVNGLSKRCLDIVGAVILGVAFSPFIVCIVIWIRLTGSPVIYGHRRVGRNGKVFHCLKFRTMVPDAGKVLKELLESDDNLKAEWFRDHKLRNDPRITPLGRFLRRTSLDELPQLWNVFRGEMSLVGPRPVVWDELSKYGRSVTTYLATRPGITGLWQVNGRSDTSYRRRVAMDVYYARNHSFVIDMYILFKTTRVVMTGHGAY